MLTNCLTAFKAYINSRHCVEWLSRPITSSSTLRCECQKKRRNTLNYSDQPFHNAGRITITYINTSPRDSCMHARIAYLFPIITNPCIIRRCKWSVHDVSVKHVWRRQRENVITFSINLDRLRSFIHPRETLPINARAHKNTVKTTNWNTELA